MKKLFLFVVVLATTVMNLNAETVTDVKYIDDNGKEQTCATATVVENATSQVTWNAGWYVVNGTNVTLSKGAVCNGAVHLILADGAKLTATGGSGKTYGTASAGIQVTGNSNSLTIYGQEGQTGTLIATGGVNDDDENYAAAGIGGGAADEADCSGSNITINGGIVTANGGAINGAGIGGGYSMMGNAFGKNITINGGIVTANGGYEAAGIGGGNSDDADCSGSKITINGGTVTATGGGAGAGIGGGSKGSGSNITINGGKVTATAKHQRGAGIGGGMNAHGSNITITGGEVTATGADYAAGIGGGYEGYNGSNITITGGKVTAQGGINGGAGIGGGRNGTGSYITIEGGEVKACGGEYSGDAIGAGALGNASNIYVYPYMILKADNNNPPTTVIAHASITTDIASQLAGKRYATAELPAVSYVKADGTEGSCNAYKVVENASSQVTWKAGWYLVKDADVVLSEGATCLGNVNLILADSAKLTATGLYSYGEAAINLGMSGSFTIYGQTAQTGKLIATGLEGCAAIGGGFMSPCGTINIFGGNITANGGSGASAIGPGMGTATVYVSPSLILKADGNNPPTTVIAADRTITTNIGSQLAGQRYATLTPVPTVVQITLAAEYGTYVSANTCTLPEGLKAYSCASISEQGVLQLEEDSVLRENTPYILKGTADSTYTCVITSTGTYTEPVKVGLLTGVYSNTTAPVGSYVLQNLSSVLGFYQVATGKQPTVGANHCYITLPAPTAKVLYFDETATGVESLTPVLSSREGEMFNLQGMKVDANYKGIVIKNGKKYLVR